MTFSAEQIHRLHRLAHREWTAAARQLGLSFNEFEYLSAIHEEERLQRYDDKHGQHLQDIVEALGVTKASASTMVSKLEGRGLAERFQCKMDARAQHIVLTDQGRALLKMGNAVYERVAHSLVEVKAT